MEHFISLQEASLMTGLYRAEHENILRSAFQERALLPLSESFDRESFDSLLAQANCAGIRIYYGMDEGLGVHAVVVAVDLNGFDILPTDGLTEAVILENGMRCPDICPPASPLNSSYL